MARMIDGLILIAKSKNKKTSVIFDQRELVMCRNCKHYNTTFCGAGFGWCERLDRGTNDNWFCADGEREHEK